MSALDDLDDLREFVRQVLREPQPSVGVGAWHAVGGTGEPAFENSWVNSGGSYETVGFRWAGPRLLALRGTCNAGALGSTIFTLPAAYRPALNRRAVCGVYDAGSYYPGILLVTTAGLVQVYSTGPSGGVDEVDVEAVLAL